MTGAQAGPKHFQMQDHVWPRWCFTLLIVLPICGPLRAQDSLQQARQFDERMAALAGAERYEEAIPYAKRAVELHEAVQGANDLDTARAVNNLAEMYRRSGAYGKAEPLYQRALAVFLWVHGPAIPETGSVLNNLGLLYQSLGRYEKAEQQFLGAIAIYDRAPGAGNANVLNVLRNLSSFYLLLGALDKAEPLLERELSIRRTIPLAPGDMADTMNSLAMVLAITGEESKAESMLREALAAQEAAGDPTREAVNRSLNNLAALYQHRGDAAQSEPLFLRTLANRQKAFGSEHVLTSGSINNLGWFYWSTGRNALAEPLFLHALAIRERVLGPDHPLTAQSLANLALLYRDTERGGQGEPLLRRALAIYLKANGPDDSTVGEMLAHLWSYEWSTGQAAEARTLAARTQAVRELNFSKMLLVTSEERRRKFVSTLSIDADITFSLADDSPAARSLGAAAVLQFKGRTLDATAESMTRLRRNLDERGRQLFDQLTELIARMSKLSLDGPGTLPIETYRRQLDELSAEKERLQTDLSRRSAGFDQAIRPVRLEDVQQAIDTSDVLVEWIRFIPFDPRHAGPRDVRRAAHYAAFLIVRDATPMVVDLGDADAIEQAVAGLRDRLSTGSGVVRPQEARAVFDLVVRPLLAPLARLKADPARLLLSPDGALNLIPFATLVDEQGEFLGQRFEISYLTSGRDLLRLVAPAEPARDEATVFAAIDFGGRPAGRNIPETAGARTARSVDFDRAAMRFKPLNQTGVEALLIQQLLKLDDAHVVTGHDASETRIKRLHGPRILHVATHGFFLSDRPSRDRDDISPNPVFSADFASMAGISGENPLLRSGLALAGANARQSVDGEDGILTAAEAAQLDLQGTQLVVLSACETGSGEIVNGEGVYGLRRALTLAGARSQLVSLWKVDDGTTEALMGEYYRRLTLGEGRAHALAAAQRMVRDDPRTAAPYFWAAFLPIGDWRPITALSDASNR